MKLSFIVGAFNRPGRLRTCLASLADQTFTDWEAIVVDNSDQPEAIELQREYCKVDPRIRYEHIGERAFDPHIGFRSLYTATEIGTIMARGEWLCFPNDDSYYAPCFAARMLDLAKAEALELVYCDLVLGRDDRPYHWLSCQPHNCAIDKTCFLLKREWFTGFPQKSEMYPIADGLLVDNLIYRSIRQGKLNQTLVMHN